MPKNIPVLLGLCTALGATPALAAPDDYEFTEPAPWKETQKSLPDYPKDEDLLSVDLTTTRSSFDYFIDAKNISTDEDEIVRYTLVITSESGAKNVLHEGIRCGLRKYKTYAYGSGDATTFQEVKEPVWKKIDRTGPGAFRNQLFSYYLCAENELPLTPRQIVERIKYPQRDR
ncbi:MAG: CNP1-like family protein [Pseudomonadota bacterium]